VPLLSIALAMVLVQPDRGLQLDGRSKTLRNGDDHAQFSTPFCGASV